MGNLSFGKLFSALLPLLLFVNMPDIFLAKADVESKVYIVYLGRRQHDDHKLVTSSHHEMLSTVLGSKEVSADSKVYSYKHGFSGFAAKLTPSQAQKIAELPGVLHVMPNHFYKLHTTRSWDYLDLSSNSANNLLHDSKLGEDIIIGVVDTGVLPESEAFKDEGLGPIPYKWKGLFQAGPGFDPKKNCSRKLIGARYFIDGYLAEFGMLPSESLSARDAHGHGTHTASTAGGSFVNNVSHNGLGFGTLRGGAPRYCHSLTRNDTWMTRKIVLCFIRSTSEQEIVSIKTLMLEVGASGLIVAKNPVKALDEYNDNSFPCIQVNFQTGTEILNYIRSTRSPRARLKSSKTHIGKPISTYVASFSSRGPNTLAPAILKPEVTAPGANILAAVPSEATNNGFNFKSGTSMATPHVTGIIALLKSLHPKWSPAAIKSALVTTAWTTDPYSGEPIFAEGMTTKVADPFDFGGGIVNPNGARDPGLVYDMGTTDYIHYLCARGYHNSAISQMTEQAITCPKMSISLLDLNVPSITIPSLRNSVNVTRTVTNVGTAYSIYKAFIEPPQGYIIKVRPDYLKFTPEIKTISFVVTVSTSHQATTEYYFGSLTWTDGMHKVRIPISVKTEIPECVG